MCNETWVNKSRYPRNECNSDLLTSKECNSDLLTQVSLPSKECNSDLLTQVSLPSKECNSDLLTQVSLPSKECNSDLLTQVSLPSKECNVHQQSDNFHNYQYMFYIMYSDRIPDNGDHQMIAPLKVDDCMFFLFVLVILLFVC